VRVFEAGLSPRANGAGAHIAPAREAPRRRARRAASALAR
jgi:hypothetical protein